jgi:tRNA-splicing ligase RtcB
MPIQAVLTKARVPIKIWEKVENVESEALNQLTNCANLPFVFKHVAAMSDVHVGSGATIGSVIATQGAIIPSAVGVDQGCGIMAVKTNLDPKRVLGKLPEIRHSIERSIPTGHRSNSRIEKSVEKWEGWNEIPLMDAKEFKVAKAQLGSLGGGNHFIEVCLEKGNMCQCVPSDGIKNPAGEQCTDCNGGIANQSVWVMLHSGSRNIGNRLALKHIRVAKDMCKKMMVPLPDSSLSYLPEGTAEFDQYWSDLQWSQRYAEQNRVEMMNRVMKDLSYAVNDQKPIDRIIEVNCHHNYAARENHFGSNVIITRKGAVRARSEDMGIIPGSMGGKSFIVIGRGCDQSFHSCSHGAGRKMSRSEAKRRFTLSDLHEQTSGIECRKDAGCIDEIPGAYKDIDKVMSNQTDLVEVVAELKQVLCVKG